jgi:hypothetical protein
VTPRVSNLLDQVDHMFKRHPELLEFKTGFKFQSYPFLYSVDY